MSRFIVVSFLVLVLPTLRSEANQPESAIERASVTGTLVSGSNGQPAAGVAVLVEGLELGTRSVEGGRFMILNVPPGPHTLTIAHPCFMTVRVELDEAGSPGAQRVVNIGLPPREAVDGGGEPLRGCYIYR